MTIRLKSEAEEGVEKSSMDNFFYQHPKDTDEFGIAFWILEGNGKNNTVPEAMEYLSKKSEIFSRAVNVPIDCIRTGMIINSISYKHKRIFFARSKKKPSESTSIPKELTMSNWIKSNV